MDFTRRITVVAVAKICEAKIYREQRTRMLVNLPMKGSFFAELQRRNVYKVAAAYAVVAWLLIQVATLVFPFFGISNSAVQMVILLLVLEFPSCDGPRLGFRIYRGRN